MPIDIQRARALLKELDLKRLFIEELNWANPRRSSLSLQCNGQRYHLTPQAEQGGLVLLTVDKCPGDGLPDRNTRLALHRQLLDRAQEHILVFVNEPRTSTLWMWVEREGGKRKAIHEHRYHVQQPGDSLLQKLEGLAFDWDELDEEGRASIIQVTDRVRANLAAERVTKRFYDEFQKQHGSFLKFIKGIEGLRDREWYASIMLNRLMFLYFIQKKGFLGGDTGYLRTRLADCQMQGIPYYDGFLKTLFFKGLACKPEERTADERKLLGEVPYLNGGLFLKHQIEEVNGGLDIPDEAFEAVFAFFDRYQWHLDDRPLRADNEINPDVLGYIFEKYINQKQMGAYYTKEDITEYITKNTVLPFLFDKLKSFCRNAVDPLPVDDIEPYIHDAVKKGVDLDLPPTIAAGLEDVSQRGDWNRRADEDFSLPTETWREHIARRKRYQQILDDFAAVRITTINDFITYNLDLIKFVQDFVADTDDPLVIRAFYFECLKTVTILDPTCGSGAFLFAALNILEPLYELCLERMEDFLGRKQRHPQWAQPFEQELRSVADHPSRRYFIYKSIIVSNLYGVDIMEEAVEICKLRLFLKLVAQVADVAQVEPLPDIDFNIRAGNTLVGYASLEEIEQAKAGKFDFGGIVDRVKAVDRSISTFRKLQTESGISAQHFREAKENLLRDLRTLEAELNNDLAFEYGVTKQKDLPKFVESHKPFHWYIEFYDIMAHGGFDVVIGNPPYVSYAKVRDTYRLPNDGYQTAPCGNLYAFVVERSVALQTSTGRTGFILPLSSTNANGNASLQEVLRCLPALNVSHYAVRPSKLFDGVDMNLTIVCAGGNDRIHATTNLIRWPSVFREHVFATLSYSAHDVVVKQAAFPKFGHDIEVSAWSKLTSAGPAISECLAETPREKLVFHSFGRYWRKCIREVLSDNYQEIEIPARIAHFVLCLLNSQLAYWYWVSCSDCYRFTKTDALNLPVPAGADDPIWRRLGAALLDSYEANAVIQQKTARNGLVVAEKQFFPARSKPIIDEIDRVLAEHYGFTDEELDFIINYDIKYRMGAEEGEE
jgi:hypothetical protein